MGSHTLHASMTLTSDSKGDVSPVLTKYNKFIIKNKWKLEFIVHVAKNINILSNNTNHKINICARMKKIACVKETDS